MTMLEKIKIVAEIVALILAAAWAVYGFIVMKKRELAVADMREKDLTLKKLEIDTRMIAVIQPEMTTRLHTDKNLDHYTKSFTSKASYGIL